ncbi:hypothetical protein KL936_001292 [Ogataea polymorpha]|nr:hypothetical protein KL936_001292 [Ogataea polymorpha]
MPVSLEMRPQGGGLDAVVNVRGAHASEGLEKTCSTVDKQPEAQKNSWQQRRLDLHEVEVDRLVVVRHTPRICERREQRRGGRDQGRRSEKCGQHYYGQNNEMIVDVVRQDPGEFALLEAPRKTVNHVYLGQSLHWLRVWHEQAGENAVELPLVPDSRPVPYK